ncbi:MAG: T9SS type A sorting domain-containing protein [Muribaculaceae bacterium]|nr:T9SS type A sorting domain-containing protein [Muribaculaceae bacterium]MCI9030500.1 T9SS type A sorting domain-containing protein [Muribaculaceae bacterium]
MKHLILFILLCISSHIGYGQHIRFTYDDAGNRIRRELVTIQEVNTQDRKMQKFLTGNNLDSEITINADKSSNLIHINTKDRKLQGEYKIAMYSIAGYMVLESQLSITGYAEVDISQLPKGVYVLVVTNGTESKAWKITKSE